MCHSIVTVAVAISPGLRRLLPRPHSCQVAPREGSTSNIRFTATILGVSMGVATVLTTEAK